MAADVRCRPEVHAGGFSDVRNKTFVVGIKTKTDKVIQKIYQKSRVLELQPEILLYRHKTFVPKSCVPVAHEHAT